jgi:hypothetical protein
VTPAQRIEAEIWARSLEQSAARLRALRGPLDTEVWLALRLDVDEVATLLSVAEVARMGATSPPTLNRAESP